MPGTIITPDETLRLYAGHLNALRRRRFLAQPFYDGMADALVWPDEITPATPIQLVGALRFITHYRTGLILGEARPHGEWWELGRQLFPHWIGFHSSRCQPSRCLVRRYKEGSSSFDRSLDLM